MCWLRNILLSLSLLKQIAASSSYTLTHTYVLPNQQPFWTDFYICLCQNDAHFHYYSNIYLLEEDCFLCSSPFYVVLAFRQKNIEK